VVVPFAALDANAIVAVHIVAADHHHQYFRHRPCPHRRSRFLSFAFCLQWWSDRRELAKQATTMVLQLHRSDHDHFRPIAHCWQQYLQMQIEIIH
jgi:hypothetical protein